MILVVRAKCSICTNSFPHFSLSYSSCVVLDVCRICDSIYSFHLHRLAIYPTTLNGSIQFLVCWNCNCANRRRNYDLNIKEAQDLRFHLPTLSSASFAFLLLLSVCLANHTVYRRNIRVRQRENVERCKWMKTHKVKTSLQSRFNIHSHRPWENRPASASGWQTYHEKKFFLICFRHIVRLITDLRPQKIANWVANLYNSKVVRVRLGCCWAPMENQMVNAYYTSKLVQLIRVT